MLVAKTLIEIDSSSLLGKRSSILVVSLLIMAIEEKSGSMSHLLFYKKLKGGSV